MTCVLLQDLDGKPVAPLHLTVDVVPSKGDKIVFWNSAKAEQGSVGWAAEVDHVLHRFYRAKGDQVIYLVLRNVQTIEGESRLLAGA